MNKTKIYTIIVCILGLFFAHKNLFSQSIVGNNPAFGKWVLEKINIKYQPGTSKEFKKNFTQVYNDMFMKAKGKMAFEFFPSGKGIATLPTSLPENSNTLETKEIKSWQYDTEKGLLILTIDAEKEEKNKVIFKGKQMILIPSELQGADEMEQGKIPTLEIVFNKK